MLVPCESARSSSCPVHPSMGISDCHIYYIHINVKKKRKKKGKKRIINSGQLRVYIHDNESGLYLHNDIINRRYMIKYSNKYPMNFYPGGPHYGRSFFQEHPHEKKISEYEIKEKAEKVAKGDWNGWCITARGARSRYKTQNSLLASRLSFILLFIFRTCDKKSLVCTTWDPCPSRLQLLFYFFSFFIAIYSPFIF